MDHNNPLLKRRPRRVDFDGRRDDHECARLALGGMATALIVARTGLSESQIAYRKKKFGMTKANGASTLDFRNGRGPLAADYINFLENRLERKIAQFVHQHLNT